MKRNILINWDKEDKVYSIIYDLANDKNQHVTFSVRTPSTKWNYWLAMGVDYHSPVKMQPEDNNEFAFEGCRLTGGKCYGDGSSLAGHQLWEDFFASGDEEIIWKKLEELHKEWIKE